MAEENIKSLKELRRKIEELKIEVWKNEPIEAENISYNDAISDVLIHINSFEAVVRERLESSEKAPLIIEAIKKHIKLGDEFWNLLELCIKIRGKELSMILGKNESNT